MSDKDKQGLLQKHETTIMWGLVIFAVVALVVVLGFYFARFYELKIVTKPEELGVFGDYVGGVLNPIFAFLAFLILMLSFRLQSKELRETRDELRKSSDAQLEQVDFAKQQLKLLGSQNFESLFFRLLELKEKSLRLYEFKPLTPEVLHDGRQRYTIPSGHSAVEQYLDFYYLSLNSENKKLDFKEFDLYIYRVFNILSVIESTPYMDENESKERYAEILIFGLTQHELRVIFYYFSISESKKSLISNAEALYLDKRVELIKKYRVLRNLNIDDTETLINILGPFSSVNSDINKIYDNDIFLSKFL